MFQFSILILKLSNWDIMNNSPGRTWRAPDQANYFLRLPLPTDRPNDQRQFVLEEPIEDQILDLSDVESSNPENSRGDLRLILNSRDNLPETDLRNVLRNRRRGINEDPPSYNEHQQSLPSRFGRILDRQDVVQTIRNLRDEEYDGVAFASGFIIYDTNLSEAQNNLGTLIRELNTENLDGMFQELTTVQRALEDANQHAIRLIENIRRIVASSNDNVMRHEVRSPT